MQFGGASDVHAALERLDRAKFWPSGARATLVLLGGAVLFLYGIDYRRTADLDAHVSTARELRDRLEVTAEQLGISFRAGGVMWVSEDFEDKAQPVPWQFQHLDVKYLAPYDFVLSKLARWHGNDREDVRRVLPILDPVLLRDAVKAALPLYIGDERSVRSNWRDVCRMLQREDLAAL